MRRFILAQDEVYDTVVSELSNGKKETHWIWFIFPQIVGLGLSPISNYYSIQNLYELSQYVSNPTLNHRLNECLDLLLSLDTNNAVDIFGELDASKLHACLTLFMHTREFENKCDKLLRKFFNSELHKETVQILKKFL